MMLKSLLLFFLSLLFSGLISYAYSQKTEEKLKQLTADADVIITGKVSGQSSGWNADKTRIFTQATLKVDEYLKGNNNGNSVVVTYPGGEVGGIGELYTHMPKFANDEDVLVFLKKDEKGFKVSDGEEGKIKIIKDEKTGDKTTSSKIPVSYLKMQIKNYLKKN